MTHRYDAQMDMPDPGVEQPTNPPRPAYPSRTRKYVPTNLSTSGNVAELDSGYTSRGRPPRIGRIAFGDADELNRDGPRWWWADVQGDGTHWSKFRGHHVQIDIVLHTENQREVNEWKGRDEIRPSGSWTLALNRQPIWEGRVGADPLNVLWRIHEVTQKLLDHHAINWNLAEPAAEQLMGRLVFFRDTPARISSVVCLEQGCVILSPVGTSKFPPPVWSRDGADDIEYDDTEDDHVKVDLLDQGVWWWREPGPHDWVEVGTTETGVVQARPIPVDPPETKADLPEVKPE